MEKRNKTVSEDFSLDSQGILYKKTRDHENEISALAVPKPLKSASLKIT